MNKITIERRYNKKDGAIDSYIKFKRDGDKEFVITFGGNLDLYYSLNNFEDDPSFIIGIDNYELYSIFDTLYHDVINGNTVNDDVDNPLDDLFDDLFDFRITKEENESYRERSLDLANRTGLITGETIVWRSDDYPHDIAPYFVIEKLDYAYKISFLLPPKPKNISRQETYHYRDYEDGYTSVRLRNDGSTYQMFNVPFMKAFNSLLEMELDNPQIHIAEYLLDRKLANGESLEKILTLKKDR